VAQAYGTNGPYVYPVSRTFPQLQGLGLGGLIETIIANQTATVDPDTAPTAAATGGGATGGLLAAGTYYLVFTETNGLGETKISPESSQLTVGATNIPRVTFPALKTNNQARHLYVGAVNGASGGPYKRYASWITSTTHDMTTASPATSDAVAPPSVNGTAPDARAIGLLRKAKRGDYQGVVTILHDVMTAFHRGAAVDYQKVFLDLQRAQWALKVIERSCTTLGESWRANPGTISTTIDVNGQARTVRTWP